MPCAFPSPQLSGREGMMRCDVCHRNIEGTKRVRTIYGWIQFCPECKVRWENRPIGKEEKE